MTELLLVCIALCVAVGSVISKASNGTRCSEYEFPCESGGCIEKGLWCDAEEDCEDGSDEEYCKKGTYFSKDPNKCDEQPLNYFRCKSGLCIPLVGKCDGTYDCDDKTDEDPEICTIHPLAPQNTASRKASADSLPDVEYFKSKQEVKVLQPEKKVHHRQSHANGEFVHLDYSQYDEHCRSALKWLISQRGQDYGWGEDTPRGIVSLFLSREKTNNTDETDMLMKKQLDIKLSIRLARNQTKAMTLSDLALYINALQVTCSNPRNFYGYDLVDTLRQRVNVAHRNATRFFVNPLVYLTLCVANATSYHDHAALQAQMGSRVYADRVDMKALTLLAGFCIAELPKDSSTQVSYREAQNNFKQIVHREAQNLVKEIKTHGCPGNVYEVALMVQALDTLEFYDLEWKRHEALDFILNEQTNGSFGDVLATYYVLQVLSGRNLLTLRATCKPKSTDLTPLEVLKNTRKRRIFVDYALNFGNPIEMTKRHQFHVAEGTNFLDVMRMAQDSNPNFRFKLDKNRKVPFVYSIGGVPNDSERGLYWKLHLASREQRSRGQLLPFSGSIKDLVPVNGDEILFWFRPL